MKTLTVVWVVITKESKMLILKRALKDSLPNEEWTSFSSLFKDKKDENGNGSDVVKYTISKLKEKTGLTVKTLSLACFKPVINNEEGKLIVNLIVTAKYTGKKNKLILDKRAYSDYQWIEKTDIHKFKTAPWLTKCLELIQKEEDKKQKK